MEVHAHSHSHGKKNWKQYFWEFLMLFLAVFCGFLAEYKLEHTIEHQRENEFMKTLIQDLENDTANFSRSIKTFNKNAALFDSLKTSIKNPITNKEILDFYSAATIAYRFSSFNYSDRTIEQLRSAGNFRLIQKAIVSDTLIEYDRNIRHTYMSIEKIMEQNTLHLQEMLNELVDYDAFSFLQAKNKEDMKAIKFEEIPVTFRIINKDPAKLAHYYNSLGTYRDWCVRMVGHSRTAKRDAISLIALVKKEYHLK